MRKFKFRPLSKRQVVAAMALVVMAGTAQAMALSPNPSRIETSQVSKPVVVSVAKKEAVKSPVNASSKPAPREVVTVTEGDTLSQIAKDHSTDWQRLYDGNTGIADPDLIHVGDKVEIPRADEQLAHREAPVDPAPVAPVVAATPVQQAAPVRQAPAPTYSGGGTGIGILEAIKRCESGGNYTAQNPSSTASGAYQFLDSTWAGYGGYARAMYAPPAVQDQYAVITYNSSGTTPWNPSRSCWGN